MAKNRLVDLRYGMQHLQARFIYQKNPRAAVKMLDAIIKDVEA